MQKRNHLPPHHAGLETAIGALRMAAEKHLDVGDEITAQRLFEIGLQVKLLRSRETVRYLNERHLRKVAGARQHRMDPTGEL